MSRPRDTIYGVDRLRFICPHCPHSLICMVDAAVPHHVTGERATDQFIRIFCRSSSDRVRELEHPVSFMLRRDYIEESYARTRDGA